MHPHDHSIFILLDSVPPRAIKTWIKLHNNMVDYTAEHFAYFAHRRSQVMEELKQSLLDNMTCFEFKDWRRIASQQFSNTPLSTIGSIKSFPGGRFNIGVIDIERFPQFAAFYLAEDTTTAFLEMTGFKSNSTTEGLTAKELAAAGNFSHFVIRGKLTSILDLTNPQSLQEFYTHLKGIQLPLYYTHNTSRCDF
jgi:hypothetical protein